MNATKTPLEPKVLETVKEGAEYNLPLYGIRSEEGIERVGNFPIVFCKGDKSNPEVFRQDGVFTESIIQVAKQYLESVNVGPMATRETSMAITKLDEALMWIAKRAEDRRLRGVQETYQK